jgi:alanine dehydrogenase
MLRRSFAKTRLWSGSASAERAKTLASRPFYVREEVGHFQIANSPGKGPIPSGLSSDANAYPEGLDVLAAK